MFNVHCSIVICRFQYQQVQTNYYPNPHSDTRQKDDQIETR